MHLKRDLKDSFLTSYRGVFTFPKAPLPRTLVISKSSNEIFLWATSLSKRSRTYINSNMPNRHKLVH